MKSLQSKNFAQVPAEAVTWELPGGKRSSCLEIKNLVHG